MAARSSPAGPNRSNQRTVHLLDRLFDLFGDLGPGLVVLVPTAALMPAALAILLGGVRLRERRRVLVDLRAMRVGDFVAVVAATHAPWLPRSADRQTFVRAGLVRARPRRCLPGSCRPYSRSAVPRWFERGPGGGTSGVRAL